MNSQLALSLEERCVLSWSSLYGSINECYIQCYVWKETLEIKSQGREQLMEPIDDPLVFLSVYSVSFEAFAY